MTSPLTKNYASKRIGRERQKIEAWIRREKSRTVTQRADPLLPDGSCYHPYIGAVRNSIFYACPDCKKRMTYKTLMKAWQKRENLMLGFGRRGTKLGLD